VIARLEKELGVEVNFDREALYDAGIGDDMPMTASFPRVRARNALDFTLRQRDLAWIIQYEMLLITTLEAQENLEDVRVYNVADLVACRDASGELFTDFDSLIDVIEICIQPESWDSVGGAGSIAPFTGGGTKALVILQTQPVHEKLQDLLAKLRGLRRQGVLTPEMLRQLAPLRYKMYLQQYGFSKSWSFLNIGGSNAPKRLAVIKPDPLRDAVVQGNNRFAFNLYSRLNQDRQGGNLFFSPYSISTALAMTYAGARGGTAEEMARTLRFPFGQRKVHPAFRSLLKATQGAGDRGCELIVANCLWGQEGYPFQQQFLKTVADDYSAGFATVDFSNPKAAAALINARVQEQTRQKIKNLIAPGLITPEIRLVLTSAIYFKGSWTNPFSEHRTTPAPFHARDKTIRVAMMSEKMDHCRYAVVDDVQILDKPYAGGDMSMTILLPGKGPDAFAALEQALAAGKFSEWRPKLCAKEVDVYLPKFKLETPIRLDETLKAMGMRLAFSPAAADFSGMNGGVEPLWIHFVVHKACVDVNEEGTEAAAATGMGGGMGFAPPIPEFRADRPFIFLIRDNRTGSILFLGRLMKPEPLAAL
jgi:serpin B